jgi:hypothetical protein
MSLIRMPLLLLPVVLAAAPQSAILARDIPSPSPGNDDARSSIPVAACAQGPAIDGVLDDACWTASTHAAGFYRIANTAPIVEQTEAWVCADGSHLYVAFHCLDSHPELIRAGETHRSGDVSQDDRVGIDIDSQNTHRYLSTFAVTARGVQWESLVGGTTDNITWAGDWTAAARRAPDGWTAEIAIPFTLLKYPHAARSLGIRLFRQVARETSSESWPELPAAAATDLARYLPAFGELDLPDYAPHPVFLPYTLGIFGTGAAVRQGLDIKYPLTTTLTGVATFHPDFQTIEQNVADVNFSYTEHFVQDRRPFFAEGAGYLPARALFYSPRIERVDEGFKIVGQHGATSIGVLGATASGGVTAAVADVRRDIGAYGQVAAQAVSATRTGQPSNFVANIHGQSGWRTRNDTYRISADHAQSWEHGVRWDGSDQVRFSLDARDGHPGYYVRYNDIGPAFISRLGYVPDRDFKGAKFDVYQRNYFDKGRIERYAVDADIVSYGRHTGGGFYKEFAHYISLDMRAGWGFGGGAVHSRREQFHDEVWNANVYWNRKAFLKGGVVNTQFGRQAGKDYRFISISQGFPVTRSLSLSIAASRVHIGPINISQTVVTGRYLLDPDRTIGGRIVAQDGKVNLFVSYSQQVRRGTDIFLVYGDPNGASSRNQVAVKLTRPF